MGRSGDGKRNVLWGWPKYSESIGGSIWLGSNASVNSTCAQMGGREGGGWAQVELTDA